jgi:hypothetical protein
MLDFMGSKSVEEMGDEAILENAFNEYSTIEIMISLGVVPPGLDKGLVGVLPEPVLDVGCGRNALFVQHMRASGLEAEGLDPEIVDELTGKPYLMKASADAIPRPDGYYGAAVSHMSFFQSGMFLGFYITMAMKDDITDEPEYREYYRETIKPDLMKALGEIRRVLRSGSPFIINPAPTYFLRESGKELVAQGYRFSLGDVPPVFPKNIGPNGEIAFEYTKRMTLVMPG